MDAERIIDIAPLLTAEDFYDPVYRQIYRAIASLHEQRKSIDFVTVNEALAENAVVREVGGSAFLAELAAAVPTSSHAEQYAVIVREKALKRGLVAAGKAIVEEAGNPSVTADAALDAAERRLLAFSRSQADARPRHIAELGKDAYSRYTELYEADDKTAHFGVTTGFGQLDQLLTGLPPGHLMIVAARPSMGKTALALDIARHVASKQGRNVAIFSLEMTSQELMDRIIGGFLGVQTWKLKKGELTPQDFEALGPFFDQLESHPIFIDDDPDTTLAHLRSKARRQQVERGLDLLIVDYLQLIEVPDNLSRDNRTQQVSHISRSLKNLARELQCPIIALSQLSRSVENRNPPIPVLSDLRDSGSIEQDADSVLMLYREGSYNEDCDDPALTDVYVRKNRNGPTGRVSLRFLQERMIFQSTGPVTRDAQRTLVSGREISSSI